MSFIEIDGFKICYEKYGHGQVAVLIIPGAIGRASCDFDFQFDPDHPGCFDFNRFTFICVELIGWGRSCPPERPYGPTLLHDDADRCDRLMRKLGYNEYSIFGWCEGTKIAVIMAQKFVNNVKNLILQAPYIYHDDKMTEKLKIMRDFANWDARLRRQYKIIYNNNADRAEKLWQTYVDFMIEKYNDIYKDGLLGPKNENGHNQIVCPTMIFIGERDFFFTVEQCENFTKEFRNGKLIVYEGCGHFLQRRGAIKFKENMENFLLNKN